MDSDGERRSREGWMEALLLLVGEELCFGRRFLVHVMRKRLIDEGGVAGSESAVK